MKKNEMKNIATKICDYENLTMIKKSVYFSENNKTMLFNAYDNEYGDCKNVFIDVENAVYSIQLLSSVTIHKMYHKNFHKTIWA